MWKLATYGYSDYEEVLIDGEGYYFYEYIDGGDGEYEIREVTPDKCFWKWWSIDFGFVGNEHPYTVGEPSPDFDPTE